MTAGVTAAEEAQPSCENTGKPSRVQPQPSPQGGAEAVAMVCLAHRCSLGLSRCLQAWLAGAFNFHLGLPFLRVLGCFWVWANYLRQGKGEWGLVGLCCVVLAGGQVGR